MPQTESGSSNQGSSGFYIGYQLPKPNALEQAYLPEPSHYDIFLAYAASSVPIVQGLNDAIIKEGFNPWRGDLETLVNSNYAEDPYRGIHQCDAFVLILGKEVEIPAELEDEVEQALTLDKLFFVVAQQPIESRTFRELDVTWLQVAVESDGSLKKLAQTVVSSLAYKRLLTRAEKWKEGSCDSKYLLSSGDAEASFRWINWLRQCPELGFGITLEQEQFLEKSQNQAGKRKDYFQGKPPDIFISYCSKDRDFVRELKIALEEQELGIWIDFENIPIATDWRLEVADAIRITHTFVFVISPQSLASNPCNWEIEQARQHNRRIIPICINHDFEQESLRKIELAAINYISFRRQTFAEAVGELAQAISTDLDDVKIYNRLYRQAFEWATHNRQKHLLMGTSQLREIKAWQEERTWREGDSAKLLDLQPVQMEYISASQSTLDLAGLRTLGLLALGLSVVVIGLTAAFARAALGEIQALVASLEDKSGLDGVLTALQASRRLEHNFLLTPMSANLPLEVRTILHQETLIARELNRLDGHDRAAYSVAFSPDAEFIISTGQDTTVQVWNFFGSLMTPLTKHQNEVLAVEYSSDGDFFVSGDADGTLNVWSCRPKVIERYPVASNGLNESSLPNRENPCQWIETLSDGPTERIARLSISPGSQYIAASSFDGNVYLWKRSAGPELFQFMKKLPHNGFVFGLDFNSRERILVSADVKGHVKVWPLEGDPKTSPPTPLNNLKINDLVYDTRFSFDGKLVAIGGANGLLKVWDRETGRVVDLPGHLEGYVHVLFHPFERRLISADTEGFIYLWQPDDLDKVFNHGGVTLDGKPPKPSALLGHQGSITRIRFSSDGSYLASASVDDTIRLWLTEDGTLLDVMEGHEDEVLNLAFSPERGAKYGRSYLASSSRDGTVRLWQINNDVRPLRHENRLYDVTFHPDGKVLAASGRSRISLWRLGDYKLLGRVNGLGEILSVHYSPNGEFLASGDSEGKITVWKHPAEQYQSTNAQENSIEKEPYQEWFNTDLSATKGTKSAEVAVVRFHPNSQVIASGNVEGKIQFWDTQGTLLGQQAIDRNGYGVTSLDFSVDGKYLVAAAAPKLAENALAASRRSGAGQIESYEVKVDDQTMRVSLRRISTIDESTLGSHEEGVLTVSFNPANPNEFVSGSEDGEIKIWNVTGRLVKTLSGRDSDVSNTSNNRITHVEYSQDGHLLVSSSEDGTVKFWNPRTGRMISSLKRHERQVAKVVFSPIDSTMLASAGFDAQVLIWNIPNDFHVNPLQKLVSKACLSADKYLALVESGDDKIFINNQEKEIRTYCLKKAVVEEPTPQINAP